MNPCPCGFHGDRSRNCVCTAEQVSRYRTKVSGPLLDRIDLFVEEVFHDISSDAFHWKETIFAGQSRYLDHRDEIPGDKAQVARIYRCRTMD